MQNRNNLIIMHSSWVRTEKTLSRVENLRDSFFNDQNPREVDVYNML
jgi:hypothetical protein